MRCLVRHVSTRQVAWATAKYWYGRRSGWLSKSAARPLTIWRQWLDVYSSTPDDAVMTIWEQGGDNGGAEV